MGMGRGSRSHYQTHLNFRVCLGRSDWVEKALDMLACVTAETSLVLETLLSEDFREMLSGLCLREWERLGDVSDGIMGRSIPPWGERVFAACLYWFTFIFNFICLVLSSSSAVTMSKRQCILC